MASNIYLIPPWAPSLNTMVVLALAGLPSVWAAAWIAPPVGSTNVSRLGAGQETGPSPTAATVYGILLERPDVPVVGAEIRAERAGVLTSPALRTKTDIGGRFELTLPSAGMFIVKAYRPSPFGVMGWPEMATPVSATAVRAEVGKRTRVQFPGPMMYSIQGRVVGPKGRKMRAGVRVGSEVWPPFFWYATDLSGAFELRCIEPGQQVLRTLYEEPDSSARYTTVLSAKVEIDAASVGRSFTVEFGSATIEGSVCRKSNESPVAGVPVLVRVAENLAPNAPLAEGETVTDESGRFRVGQLPEGKYWVVAGCASFHLLDLPRLDPSGLENTLRRAAVLATFGVEPYGPIQVNAGKTTTVNLQVSNGRDVLVRVVDRAGSGVAGVFVDLVRRWNPEGLFGKTCDAHTVQTDANGSATVSGLGRGEYWASMQGYGPAEPVPLEVKDTAITKLTIRVEVSSRVRVIGRTRSGGKVRLTSVAFANAEGRVVQGVPGLMAREDTEDWFSFLGALRPGRFEVRGVDSGGRKASAMIEVEEGKPSTVELEFDD